MVYRVTDDILYVGFRVISSYIGLRMIFCMRDLEGFMVYRFTDDILYVKFRWISWYTGLGMIFCMWNFVGYHGIQGYG